MLTTKFYRSVNNAVILATEKRMLEVKTAVHPEGTAVKTNKKQQPYTSNVENPCKQYPR